MTALDSTLPAPAREAISRAVRQALQAILPTLLVVAGGTVSGIDITAVVILAAITAAVSLLKSVVGLRAPAGAPLAVQLGERAATAAAGAALGLITVDGTTPAASIPWGATLTAAIGSALVAVVMFLTDPPATGEVLDDPEQLETGGGDEGVTFVGGEPLPSRAEATGPDEESSR